MRTSQIIVYINSMLSKNMYGISLENVQNNSHPCLPV